MKTGCDNAAVWRVGRSYNRKHIVTGVRPPLCPGVQGISWVRHEERWRWNLHHGNKRGNKLEMAGELSKIGGEESAGKKRGSQPG